MTISTADGITLPEGSGNLGPPGPPGPAGPGVGTIGDPTVVGNVFGNQLVYGGMVRWINNWNFVVTASKYTINGLVYICPQTNITLDASDATRYRVDSFVFQTSNCIKVNGTVLDANPNLAVEPLIDPANQLKINTMRVDPGRTQPQNLSFTNIYQDNLGSAGGEWNAAIKGLGPIVVNSPNGTYGGTGTCVEGTLAGNDYWFEFINPTGPWDNETEDILFFRINAKADWLNGAMVIQWHKGATPRGEQVVLKQGAFGFDSKLTGYKLIGIPMNLFAIDGQYPDRIRFTCVDRGGSGFGFNLDDVVSQRGLGFLTPLVDRLRWEGPYVNSRQYFLNDVVSSAGVLYRCVESFDGADRDDPTVPSINNFVYWEDMSGDKIGTIPPLPVTIWNLAYGGGRVALLGVLTVDITMGAPINMVDGRRYVLFVVQNATGGWKITSWDPAFVFPNNSPPVLSTSPSAIDVITFECYGGKLYGVRNWGTDGLSIYLANTQVAFGNAANVMTSDPSLTYNSTSGALAINKASSNVSMQVRNSQNSSSAKALVSVVNSASNSLAIGKTSPSFPVTPNGNIPNAPDQSYILSDGVSPLMIYNGTPNDTVIGAGFLEAFRVHSAAAGFGGISFMSRPGGANTPFRLRQQSYEVMTADRAISWNIQNADRIIQLGGDLSLAGGLTIAGVYPVTITVTGVTAITLPTSGLLMANPMVGIGDMIVAGTGAVPTRLANTGTAGFVLTSAGPGVVPAWQTPAALAPPLTATQVAYGDPTNKGTSSAELTYTTASGWLKVDKQMAAGNTAISVHNNSASASSATVYASCGAGDFYLQKYGPSFATNGLVVANMGGLSNTTGPMMLNNNAAADVIVATGGFQPTNERFRVYNSNGIGIRSSGAGGFNLKIGSVEALTANRQLYIGLTDADRTLSLGGNLSTSGSLVTGGPFTTAGASSLTLTTTGPTNVTLPTSGLLTAGGMRYMGDWGAATQYILNDVVSYGGCNYLAPGTMSIGVAPPTGWTQLSKPARATLTFATTVNWNLAAAPVAWLALTGNCTVANPTNAVPGTTYALQVTQDATGSRLITWGSFFRWPSGRPPSLSTAANSLDLVTFVCLDPSWLGGVVQPNFL